MLNSLFSGFFTGAHPRLIVYETSGRNIKREKNDGRKYSFYGKSLIPGRCPVVSQALQALKPAYEALDRRVAELSAQLSLAAAREEQLLAARAELRCEVDQMAVARDRSERGRDAAARRCEELTWQLREAQSAIEGVALSPLQVGFA